MRNTQYFMKQYCTSTTFRKQTIQTICLVYSQYKKTLTFKEKYRFSPIVGSNPISSEFNGSSLIDFNV